MLIFPCRFCSHSLPGSRPHPPVHDAGQHQIVRVATDLRPSRDASPPRRVRHQVGTPRRGVRRHQRQPQVHPLHDLQQPVPLDRAVLSAQTFQEARVAASDQEHVRGEFCE